METGSERLATRCACRSLDIYIDSREVVLGCINYAQLSSQYVRTSYRSVKILISSSKGGVPK